MAGAAYLSALAAYRSGTGLVRIFTPEENRIILQTLLPEAVLITYDENGDFTETKKLLKESLSDSTAVVIGPGLSINDTAKKILSLTLLRASCPLVIDADALNIIAADPSLKTDLPKGSVLTPHMGEMSRLTGIEIAELKNQAAEYSRSFAEKYGIVCAMKDAKTAVSDGERVYMNQSGCSALSKGGSGDVLTGIIASFIGCGMPPFEAACLAVYLHGRCGEEGAKLLTEYSLLAHEIADLIPSVIKKEI